MERPSIQNINLILFTSILICSCYNKKNDSPFTEEYKQDKEHNTKISPSKTIPIYYGIDNMKIIYFDIVVNDTDSAILIWDTGGYRMLIPNSYKDCMSSKDSLNLKIGDEKITYKEDIHFSDAFKSGYIEKKYKKKVFFAGWNLFRDKIVEISYTDNNFRILKNTNNLSDYEYIPFKIKDNNICIDITISIQNKIFHIKDAIIDTGFNEAFISNNKDLSGLNMTDSYSIEGFFGTDKNKVKGSILLADQIRIGNISADSLSICITDIGELKLDKWTFSNLLGNVFFENFSVVFDFKNHVLYLKSIKKTA